MFSMRNKKLSRDYKYYLLSMRDLEAAKLLKELAREDRRTISDTAALLIRREYVRRHPNSQVEVINYSINENADLDGNLP